MNLPAGFMLLAMSMLLPNLPPDYPALKDGYDYRYGIPPGTDLKALVGKPAALTITTLEFTDALSGERRMSGYCDYHGVFDVDARFAKQLLIDFETYPHFMPWISGAKILKTGGNYYRLSFSVGINILGARLGFVTESESTIDIFSDGGMGLRSRMLDSPDGNLYEHYLSWYLLPVTIDGREMTYVRYYARPGLRKPSRLTVALVTRFSGSNIRDQVVSFMKEAARRAKNAK